MAKISANAATEVERLEVGQRVYVLCSDGRLLYAARFSGGTLGSYSVYARTTVDKGRLFLAEKRAATQAR